MNLGTPLQYSSYSSSYCSLSQGSSMKGVSKNQMFPIIPVTNAYKELKINITPKKNKTIPTY